MDKQTRNNLEELYLSRAGLPEYCARVFKIFNYWEDEHHFRISNYDYTSPLVHEMELISKILEEKFLLIVSPNNIYIKTKMNVLGVLLGIDFGKKIVNLDSVLNHCNGNQDYIKSLCDKHFGEYPIVNIKFQFPCCLDQTHFIEQFKFILLQTFRAHRYLIYSKHLHADDKVLFKKYCFERNIEHLTVPDVENSLQFLCKILYKHFRKQILVLIENYDSLILYSLGNDNVKTELSVTILRNLFSRTFDRTNRYVSHGIVTGYSYIADVGISLMKGMEIYNSLLNRSYHGQPLHKNKMGRFKILRCTGETKTANYFHPTISEKQFWLDEMKRINQSSNRFTGLYIPIIFPFKYLDTPEIQTTIQMLLEGKIVDIKFVEGILIEHLMQLEELLSKHENYTDSYVHLYLQLLCHLGCFSYSKKSAKGDIYCVSLPKEERWDLYFDRYWCRIDAS